MRFRKTNSVGRLMNYSFYDLPCPMNLSAAWGVGSMLGLFYSVQLISGFFISFHYAGSSVLAFDSVLHIQRDVINGWALRNIHSNGASFMMGGLYLHTARGIYFSSYSRLLGTWMAGVVLFIMTMATAFLGYVLPWGQMSYWGATVITSLFSVIPLAGKYIVENILWGAFSVGEPTLGRFYSFHFILPFAMAIFVMMHFSLLHSSGSSNPLGAESGWNCVPFHPYFSLSDLMLWVVVFTGFMVVVFGFPHYLGCPENFELANPMKTPIHIQPEWYFLPFYAILRSIPHKGAGVAAMGFSMLSLVVMPYWLGGRTILGNSKGREILFWGFSVNWVALGWIGMCPMEYPFLTLGVFHTVLFFAYFFVDKGAVILINSGAKEDLNTPFLSKNVF